MIGTYLNTFIRKKLIMEVAQVISFLCFCLMLMVSNLTIIIVLLCIIYSLQYIINDLVICFITETVLDEKRAKHIIILFISYSLGSMLNGVLFKYFSWQNIIFFYFIVPILLAFVGLKWYIKETPFDLVTNFTPE